MAARRAFFTILCFISTPLLWRAGARSLVELIAELVWIVLLARLNATSSAWPFAAIGVVLGLAAYSHASAIVTMPLLMITGAVIVVARGDAAPFDRRLGAMMLAGMAVALPLLYRLLGGEFTRLVIARGLYDPGRFNVLQGTREVFSWVGLVARSDVYYRCFDPALLFLSGGTLRHAIVSPAVFVLPFAVLIPIGLLSVVIARPRAAAVLWAALVVPVAAALTAQAPEASRLLLLTPFAAYLAAEGIERLMVSSRLRWAGVAAAASVALSAAIVILR